MLLKIRMNRKPWMVQERMWPPKSLGAPQKMSSSAAGESWGSGCGLQAAQLEGAPALEALQGSWTRPMDHQTCRLWGPSHLVPLEVDQTWLLVIPFFIEPRWPQMAYGG